MQKYVIFPLLQEIIHRFLTVAALGFLTFSIQQPVVKCEQLITLLDTQFCENDWHKYRLVWYFYWHLRVFPATALWELPFCISCQFKCYTSLPVSQFSFSISFLCCTGAEHCVNLVIGTGPSPLYGFLLSRSTWLVKEDGMKINEVQLMQEGVGGSCGCTSLWHFHWGDSRDQQQSAPLSAISHHLFFI